MNNSAFLELVAGAVLRCFDRLDALESRVATCEAGQGGTYEQRRMEGQAKAWELTKARAAAAPGATALRIMLETMPGGCGEAKGATPPPNDRYAELERNSAYLGQCAKEAVAGMEAPSAPEPAAASLDGEAALEAYKARARLELLGSETSLLARWCKENKHPMIQRQAALLERNAAALDYIRNSIDPKAPKQAPAAAWFEGMEGGGDD